MLLSRFACALFRHAFVTSVCRVSSGFCFIATCVLDVCRRVSLPRVLLGFCVFEHFVDVSSRHAASSQVALRCACRKVALPCVVFPNVSPSTRILCVAFPKRLRHHSAFLASCFKPRCQSRSSRCVSKHCVVKKRVLGFVFPSQSRSLRCVPDVYAVR